ncbi:DNA polymerase III subunit alpha [Paenibacillus sp. FJAT-26967]|uniref:DNA polymerase III subunit alpha n=1 Tax=Paenibacillus sp. FJAT-26967 TaxID=1729690 RepID=UPI000839A7EC|nr:DNA polymerase III subunit alpha [Paenibacillus sp. FJAT-26967]
MNSFVHLHVHSEYSLLDGAARIHDLVETASQFGMKSLALTDHGVMYGAIAFYKACIAKGIKPIIGCEAYFTEGSIRTKGTRQEQPIYHLILLARNMQGYQNLMKLCSIGHLQGFHYKPRIDHENLAKYSEGLLCLSSCLGGEVSQHLLHDRKEQAKAAAERYRSIFGEDFYLEIQDHGSIEQKKVMQGMIELSRDTGIPLVATNDVHYVRQPDHVVQDVLLCIGTGKTVDDPQRLKFETSQLYLKSEEEMRSLFAHVPEALDNTVLVADKCRLELEFGKSVLPRFQPIPEELTAGEYLKELCRAGLAQRYGSRDGWQDEEGEYRRTLEDRLAYELRVIESMGFSDYFLIVWDFIRFSHENGILTGPGRGSSAGSLVAYVLRITDVDPIRYKLLFERFLNPERITMPDIDIDFNDERRDEVIDYVVAKYGQQHVAQIITFGTMAAKAAVRDVGRVLNVPYNEVDRAAKMIPGQLGMTLESALKVNPDLKELAVKQPKTGELLDMAKRVEGMPRHASTHAAGVVISREPLTHYVPLQEGTGQTPLTQYSMEHLEAIGLLKMDFLGLRTLSIIERTLRSIEEQEGLRLDLAQLDMDNDPLTYELLSRGETTGIFQLESPGVRRVLRDLKPSGFEDIVSVVALYRPGPMEFIPRYIECKHGLAEPQIPHEALVPILQDTYGIIVYQEQIMQIASAMAGFSLGEADLLRRAVSKKKREVLDEQRAHFVEGSLGQGFTGDEANRVYDMIVRFADYGFPRAHATAYGVLAFQTAYLKTHYPRHFMASMLTAVVGNHRKTAEYVDECRRMKLDVLPPDVNESGVNFTPVALNPRRLNESDEHTAAEPSAEEGNKIPVSSASEAGQSGGASSAGPDDHNGREAEREGLQARSTIQREGGGGAASAPKGAIRFGLAAIKNVGTNAIEAILKERRQKPYESLLDFCRRVDLRVCNKRVIECLIQGGALDELPGHRSQFIAMLDDTVEAALKWRKERDDLQLHLFGFVEEPNWEVEIPDVPPLTRTQQLEYERELLGLYISGHPLDDHEDLLKELEADPLHYLQDYADHSEVIVAGMVVTSKTIVTKKGQPMAFMDLEDRIAKVEVVLFPEVWKKHAPLVQKGSVVLVKGKLQLQDEDPPKLLAEALCAPDDPAARRWQRRQMRPGGQQSGGPQGPGRKGAGQTRQGPAEQQVAGSGAGRAQAAYDGSVRSGANRSETPRTDARGGVNSAEGPRSDARGGVNRSETPRTDARGGVNSAEGPRSDARGGVNRSETPRTDARGGVNSAEGPRSDARGRVNRSETPRTDARGGVNSVEGPRSDARGGVNRSEAPRSDMRGSAGRSEAPRTEARGTAQGGAGSVHEAGAPQRSRYAASGPDRAAAPRTGAERTSASGKADHTSAAPAHRERASTPAARQRVYVKIAAHLEEPQKLVKLQELLQLHSGPLEVVLFYERTQRLLALSAQYRVKPSPDLFAAVEQIMGKDCVKVK